MRKFVLAGLTAVLFSPVLLFSGEVVHMKFDGNLEDSAGGRSGRAIGTPVSYTADRFGNPGSAVLLKKGSRISLGNDKGLSFVKDGNADGQSDGIVPILFDLFAETEIISVGIVTADTGGEAERRNVSGTCHLDA